jgi:hypothetical protein
MEIEYENEPVGRFHAIIKYIGDAWPEVYWTSSPYECDILTWENEADPTVAQPTDAQIDSIFDELKQEQTLYFLRKKRSELFSEADGENMRALTSGEAISSEMQTYLQELRTIPQRYLEGTFTASVDESDPSNPKLSEDVVWPTKP